MPTTRKPPFSPTDETSLVREVHILPTDETSAVSEVPSFCLLMKPSLVSEAFILRKKGKYIFFLMINQYKKGSIYFLTDETSIVREVFLLPTYETSIVREVHILSTYETSLVREVSILPSKGSIYFAK